MIPRHSFDFVFLAIALLAGDGWAASRERLGAAAGGLRLPADLAADVVLQEPVVAQPVFLNFDERGRMWVVQYRQYPDPAGLRVVSRDSVWRVVYDRKKPPPPYDTPERAAFRGRDRITIHEDVNGDGTFAKTTTFLDGLNLTTAVVRGRGGVWVLSPPHLLFYADANRDDVPDGPPIVHLDGFNLEDTHSIANSLRWGPDGWLYGAHGSTVSADIVRPGLDVAPIAHLTGQGIWRYEPASRRFEVFAEGGGNTFGVEIDAQGRVFSGHNGGNTRGFYYPQGAYERKGFGKHGELSNPYAFGFLEPMPHPDVKRFSHSFLIYEAAALPERYRGKLIGIDPLSGWLPLAERTPVGAGFATRDLEVLAESTEKNFRPVDIKLGPDGAIYLADWRDLQINHYLNHEGKINPADGRIYRLRAANASPGIAAFDLSRSTSRELVDVLRSDNRWRRETALRLLGDRRDAALIPELTKLWRESSGQFALECLWALDASGGFTEAVGREGLRHADPFVRLWSVRLLGDARQVEPATAAALVAQAARETSVEVRSQLAASAKRLPAAAALPIVAALLTHDEDAEDRQIPLQLWWAVESKCASDREAVLALWTDATLWSRALVTRHVGARVMRRFAAAGEWAPCVTLLERAPNEAARRILLQGFEQAFGGQTLPPLPDAMAAALVKAGGASPALRLRQGDPAAMAEALAALADPKTPVLERRRLLTVFGEAPQPRAIPALAAALTHRDAGVRSAAIAASAAYDDPALQRALVENYAGFTAEQKAGAQSALTSRPSGAGVFLKALEAGTVTADSVRTETIDQIRLLADRELIARLERVLGRSTSTEVWASDAEMARVLGVVSSGEGSPYRGRNLFEQTCAACHRFHGKGGELGPDLTMAKRDDLASLVLAIVKPSAEIREGFEAFTVSTRDGAVRAGFLLSQDERRVTLRDLTGTNATLDRAQVVALGPLGRSLMPEGLFAGRSDQEWRDLFAYLRISQPLVGERSAEP